MPIRAAANATSWHTPLVQATAETGLPLMQTVKPQNVTNPAEGPPGASAWTRRYGDRHRLRRVQEFPDGVTTPGRIRIYRRGSHYVLQWWDPAVKGNACTRVDGDLIDAISTARRIEQRLEDLRSAGQAGRRLSHGALVEAFLADLQQRANAGEISADTVGRYRSALRHYLAFAETPRVAGAYPMAARVDRKFALDFAAFLDNRTVAPNGHVNAGKRRLRSQTFILDATRAAYEWGNDPARGNCMPAGFRSPFRRATLKRRTPAVDPLAEPDVTTEMARDFLKACDGYQLALFAPMILYGLRAAEPVFLFREQVQDGWVRVGCIPALAYVTKGRRDKRLPLLDELAALWRIDEGSGSGLLFVRRAVASGQDSPPLLGQSLAQLIYEYDRRREQAQTRSAVSKRKARDSVIRDAGGLSYDVISGEFRRVARQLQWPASATLKGLRHLFATSLANAGMPEYERRYLMGHAPGRDAIVTYTHLNRLADHYRHAVEQEYGAVLAILRSRVS